MLAGIHNNRFKTFISHNGLFDMKSWYGTTEELWFANFDLGGPYWQRASFDAVVVIAAALALAASASTLRRLGPPPSYLT